jgi:predicted outer membrane lipoprotein
MGEFMKPSDDRNMVLMYIALASGCAAIGTGLTFGLLAFCAYYQIDITRHWWLLGLPLAATLIINVLIIELYRRLTHR